MNKYLKFIIFWLILGVSSLALCAGTVSQGATKTVNANMKTITLTCTGTNPTDTIDLLDVEGWYLFEIHTYPGGTAPTDGADFVITDGNGMDILGGAGTDKIDETSDLRFFPENSNSENAYWPVEDIDPTLTVANQAESDGITNIKLIFVK